MHTPVGAISATLLLLLGSNTARSEPLRCSNSEATHAIDDEAAAMLVSVSRMFSQNGQVAIDAAKVSATVSDTYEGEHTDASKDCHGQLTIDYDGATTGAEIEYQVIQTDEGKVITKWPRDTQFAIDLLEQLLLQKAFAEQQAKAPNAQ